MQRPAVGQSTQYRPPCIYDLQEDNKEIRKRKKGKEKKWKEKEKDKEKEKKKDL